MVAGVDAGGALVSVVGTVPLEVVLVVAVVVVVVMTVFS